MCVCSLASAGAFPHSAEKGRRRASPLSRGDAEGSQGPRKDLRCYVEGSAWGVLWIWECVGQNRQQKKRKMCVGKRDLGHWRLQVLSTVENLTKHIQEKCMACMAGTTSTWAEVWATGPVVLVLAVG